MAQHRWSDLWIILFVLLIVIGIFAGQGLVIGLGMMGLLFTGISWLWNQVSLEHVSYERRLSQSRALIGDEVSLTIIVTNRKPVPLGKLSVDDEIPKALEIVGSDDIGPSYLPEYQTLRHSTSMSWYERMRWQYLIKCAQRGYYPLGPARMSSGDLFGFFTSERNSQNRDYLMVYPRVVPLEELGLPAARPLGDVGGGIKMFQDESRPSGIREYQHGDPLKTVDWKASAKAQSLQVRTFDPSSTITVILVVVVQTTTRSWEGYLSTNLERVILTAASVASYAAERQYSLGLFSDGTPILTDRPMRIPPDRSPEQLTIILEALATVRPLPMGPIAGPLAESSRRFPMGATLVVIAALIPPELVEVIDDLTAQGYRIVVLYVGDGECPPMPEAVLVRDLHGYFARVEMASEFGPS